MTMKQALLIAPSFDGPGGGTCVAAWALQGLRAEYQVTLLAWEKPDFALMNDRFGTNVPPDGAGVVLVPRWLGRLLDLIPFRLALLRRSILQSFARRLLRERDFDVVASAENEMDVGRRMVQYVHFPWAAYPRPGHDLRWYHPKPLVWLYRSIVIALFGDARKSIRTNLTLVNSAWTGRYYQEWYDGAPCQVLYPPAPVAPSNQDWEERRDSFICLGRFAPEKRILEMIAVLRQVRRRGFDITMDICGQIGDAAYYRKVCAAAEAEGEWVRVHLDLPRSALIELITKCRYGIHGMVGEHFGIAIAEIIRRGCLCFANRDGGPAEILGDGRLLFDDDAMAIERICAVLADQNLQDDLREKVEQQSRLFSPKSFMSGFLTSCKFISEEK
ncbi:glycosyltransferase family 4 protein [Telmatospirillum sp. J64-1]|uniref:glycosyltransferase family 4 protein n=1 Tax=Telmatospirillum sp. J64-1 TaxID=2502183 RepID=UPI00115C7DCC|nr:glycosyltransferase family 4 protein [Telmatospirillum sp. J64-1]